MFRLLLALLLLTAVALLVIAMALPGPASPSLVIMGLLNLLLLISLVYISRRVERKLVQANSELHERGTALEGSEAMLRSVFENSLDAIAVSHNGQHYIINPAFQRMFGYDSLDEVLKTPAIEMIAPSERAFASEQGRRRYAGEPVPNAYTTLGQHKDGSIFNLEMHITTFPLNGEQYTLAILRDITEQLKAEQKLRESGARYRLLFENNPGPMWVYDLETLAFLAVNDATVAQYGYSAEEFYAMKITDIRPPEDIPALLENVSKSGLGLYRAGVWRHFKKDGTLIEVEITKHGLTFAGRPAELVLVNDVTERNRAYQALQKEQAFLRQVIDSVPDFIAVCNRDGRFELVNRALAEAQQSTVAEITGRTIAGILPHSEQVERFLKNTGEVFKTGKTQILPEEEVRLGNDRVYWLSIIMTPMCEENGPCNRILVVAVDITERRKAEIEVKRLNQDLELQVEVRTQQLREMIQDLDSFTYSISHDLRAPLRALSGFTDLLLEDARPHLEQREIEDLSTIKNSAVRMSLMVEGLLAFSRLGRQAMNIRKVDNNQLVKEALQELRDEINGREIEFQISDLPPCQGDPVLLRQVWVNLISNAIKFTRQTEAAKIWIGCEIKEPAAVQAEGPAGEPAASSSMTYYVRDNGAGFDMRYASRLFGVFQRLHGGDTFPGTGVGLAITQRILRRHGGNIWAEAEEGKGATFFFTL